MNRELISVGDGIVLVSFVFGSAAAVVGNLEIACISLKVQEAGNSVCGEVRYVTAVLVAAAIPCVLCMGLRVV